LLDLVGAFFGCIVSAAHVSISNHPNVKPSFPYRGDYAANPPVAGVTRIIVAPDGEMLWDKTGIRLSKPSSALLQRLTFSSYYATNVGKGGVHQQYCGWMGTEELYTGFISDSDYFNNYEILERQQKFQENDKRGGALIKFLNILDRGYRSTRAAWRNGQQFVYQPTFAKSDRKFKANETIQAASAAADRSGNERAVRLAKSSAFIRRGTETQKSVVRICDAWLAYGFQVNFMFKSVV
jgi:hypothetical protein